MGLQLDNTDYGILASIVVILTTIVLSKKRFFKPKSGSNAASDATVESRDVVEVLERTGKKLLIVYASQTGTAEDYATKFAREIQTRFETSCLLADCESYDLDNLNELDSSILVFFFVSSYGEGEYPDSATEFGDYLESLDEGDLSELKFTSFGLGNSTYEFYNGAARRLNKSLLAAGATQFAEFGEGDDADDTLDEDYLAWKEKVIKTLQATQGFEEVEFNYKPSVSVTEVVQGSSEKYYLGERTLDTESSNLGPFSLEKPYLAPISLAKDLFKADGRHCIHVELDLSSSNLKYSTGDHLAILPHNSKEDVEFFLKTFGLESYANTIVAIKPIDATVSHKIPSPTTFGALAEYYLEITGAVSRQVLESFANYAPNNTTKQKILAVCKDKENFHNEIVAKNYNLSEALLYFSHGEAWTNVPKTFIIDTFPFLQPRFYSISSSSLKEKSTIHVTAKVEAEKTSVSGTAKKYTTGVTTNLLHNIEVAFNSQDSKDLFAHYDLRGPRDSYADFKLPVFVRRSTFKLPSNPSTPLILIGPGTGVAPLRGFIRERVEQVNKGLNVGKIMLFFGSRNSKEDFLYKEEWPEYEEKLGKDNFKLITAFSRESSKKVYVQDRMKEPEVIAEIVKHLDSNAFVYVCGDAGNMARAVQAQFAEIVAAWKGVSLDKAQELLKKCKARNQYQEDVW